jgi:TonB family protein
LGYIYAYGLGALRGRDEERAKELYQQGVFGGVARAKTCLAVLYLTGANIPNDIPLAIELLKNADTAGDLHASYDLAVLYSEDAFVPKDTAESERFGKKVGNTFDRELNGYRWELTQRVEDILYHTRAVADEHRHGVVIIEFVRNGWTNTSVRMVRSSGYDDMDAAAVSAAKNTTLPPPPPCLVISSAYSLEVTFN